MEEKCPCGSELQYAACCQPVIKGEKIAETPEQLMRSRYSAYAKTEIPFILESTHPDKRKDCDENAIRSWSSNSQWHQLEIISTQRGQAGDNDGVVEFIAHFTENRIKKALHEVSQFKRIEGKWYYFDGEIQPQKPFVRQDSKVNRNDPCPCGSGKKHKKCCG